MQKFPDIESLRHISTSIKKYCDDTDTPLPTIKFRGTTKLHGTNAGVAIKGDSVVAQGRNVQLFLGEDSFAFAQWVSQKTEALKAAAHIFFYNTTGRTVTLFGEWCGEGIQKGMAISSLPKHFVIFAAHDELSDEWVDIFQIPAEAELWKNANAEGIYFIRQCGDWEISVDFNDLVPAAEQISALTLEVENQCPWGTFRGATGIGEGIVWNSYDYPVHFQFKSKGLKHKKTGEKTRVQIDPVKTEAIGVLVSALLPEWRLEQGIETLRRDNEAVDISNTGKYLKWIAEDILKEEGDQIAANSFTWKEIVQQVSKQAREFYMAHLNRAAGLT
jgi:hypothetical protein